MKIEKSVLFISWVILLFIYDSHSLSPLHGAFIFDLEGGTNQINSYASQWVIHNIADITLSVVYTCSSWLILGQPGLLSSGGFFERTYSDLPPHNSILFEFRIFVMDEWNPGDTYDIYVDNTIILQPNVNLPGLVTGNDICGGAQKDLIDISVGMIQHNSPNLNLIISCTAGPSAGLGIRNISISLRNVTVSTFTCSMNNILPGPCPCGEGLYQDTSTPPNCLPCHSSCSQCFGPSDSGCYSCKAPLSFDGTRCRNPNSANCKYYNFLENRCSLCEIGFFNAWNGTCIPSCGLPYIQAIDSDYSNCTTPCQSNNTFMLQNNTCNSSCYSPFVLRTEGEAKFCDYPCNQAASEYRYPNGSCFSSCTLVPKTEGGINFCEYCPSGTYLYPNGTCLPSCPLSGIFSQDGQNFCSPLPLPSPSPSSPSSSLCGNGLGYYYPKEAKCKPTCTYPYRIENVVYCVLDVSDEAMSSLRTLSTIQQSAGHVQNITVTLSKLVSVCNPSAILFGSLGDLIKYIKYLRINYPPKLQYLLDLPETEGILQGLLSIPSVIDEQFAKRDLPENFKKYEIPSSFFVNFWQPYMNLLIIGGIIIALSLLMWSFKKYKKLHSILIRQRQTFKWNFLISISIGYFGDLSFYTYMEIKSVEFDSFSSISSFVVGIITNVLAVGLLVKSLMIVRKIMAVKFQYSRSTVFKRINVIKEKQKEYQVIFESFKDDSFLTLAFLPIFMLRLYVFNIVITALFEHPLVQTILTTLISFFVLFYLIKIRPFKEKKNMIENLVQEIALQMVNICVLILASLDAADCEAIDAREILGHLIIGVNTGFVILGSIYLNIQLFLSLKELISNLTKKQSPKETKVVEEKSLQVFNEPIKEEDLTSSENISESTIRPSQFSEQHRNHPKIRRPVNWLSSRKKGLHSRNSRASITE